MVILLATPWYLHQLGIAGYGVISLWLVMQILVGLLDAGMGATLVRGFSTSHDGDFKTLLYRQNLLRTLEIFYWLISICFGVSFFAASSWIGSSWLGNNFLPNQDVVLVLRLMGIGLCIQFPCSLYLNGLGGLHKHREMNLFQVLGNTLRYGVGALVLLWTSNLLVFFLMQILVAIVIVASVRVALWRQISNLLICIKPKFRLEILKKVGSFSAGMGVNALVAILLANIDRLALSKMTTAYDIGEYSLAFTAVGLLQLGIQPFYRVFFPKYSHLASQGNVLALKKEYFYSCQLLAAGIIPLGIVGWVYAPELLNGWLGNVPNQVVEIFRWLLVGICCSGLTWLPAAFQQSQGLTRLHIQMMLGALVIGFPIMIWMISIYGAIGATAVWVIHGISDLTIGLWLMHKRFLIGELSSWYKSVLLMPVIISGAIAYISWLLMPMGNSRLFGVFWSISILILIASITLFLVHKIKFKLN